MYIEKDAIYEVKVPHHNHGIEVSKNDYLTAERYREYWNGRKVLVVGENNVKRVFVKKLYEDGRLYSSQSCIPKNWLFKLIKHCPQVEHYIKSQEKQTYVSPFSGKQR